MPGLVPGIHVSTLLRRKSWMAGTRPAMTKFVRTTPMIIERQEDVTPAVLKELERAPNARFREIMGSFIRHMHDFVRESKLTEEEFRTAMSYVVALGKASNETHNEAVLIAGSLGLSSLVCLLNNGGGQTETDASLLGPFWRMHSPVTPNGGSIIRSATPRPALFVDAWFP